jgi:aryl-alcohol dehydrogenase-like predicted oxidoreductase
MRRKRLGRTDLQVSALSLGTAEIGLDYGIAEDGEARRPSEAEAHELLHFALDRGINLIDTARAYGEAEAIIGRALRKRRSEYVLTSKVMPQAAVSSLVRTQLEHSLAALQTEYLDIMMIHSRAEQVEPDRETFAHLAQAREEGLVHFIGTSVYGPDAAMRAIECGWFDCIEVGYSVLDRRIEVQVLEAAETRDVGIIARSVLLRGALSERSAYLSNKLAPLKHCISELAAVAGSLKQLPELAYRYVCHQPIPHSALIGTASKAELTDCIRSLELGPLADEQVDAIHRVHLEDEKLLNPGSWPQK